MFWRTGEYSPLPLPRRLRGALAGDGARRRRAGPPGLAARARRRLPADALDRRALLRHLPLALPDHRPHDSGGGAHGEIPSRAFFQVAAIFGVAALSWHYVEDPIRHGALGRLWAQARAVGGAGRAVTPPGRAALRRRSALVVVAAARGHGRASAPTPARRTRSAAADGGQDGHGRRRAATSNDTTRASGRPHRRLDLGGARLRRIPAEPQAADHRPVRAGRRQRPSTSRSPARARSTRRSRAIPNAQEVAAELEERRLQGLLGAGARHQRGGRTSPPARTSAYDERIDRMMSMIGDEPVLWVNVKSLRRPAAPTPRRT